MKLKNVNAGECFKFNSLRTTDLFFMTKDATFVNLKTGTVYDVFNPDHENQKVTVFYHAIIIIDEK